MKTSFCENRLVWACKTSFWNTNW